MASFLKGEVTSESLLESCREILEQGPSQPEALGIAEPILPYWRQEFIKRPRCVRPRKQRWRWWE